MTQLTVDRLSASTTPDDAPRVRRLMSGLAEHRLDEALSAVDLPPGDWCVRRVEATVQVDRDRTDAALADAWADALVAALRLRMAAADGDVVHYRRRVDGLADLLASVASGRVEREWAWRRLELLGAGDPDPVASPGATALAAVRRSPESALPALLAAVDEVGVAALHRILGAAGWTELVGTALRAQGLPGVVATDAAKADEEVGADRDRLADSVRARSRLAAAFRQVGARLRVDRPTAWAWAALAAAEVEPTLGRRRQAAAVLAALARDFTGPPAERSAPVPPVARAGAPPDSASSCPRDTPAVRSPSSSTAEDLRVTADRAVAPTNGHGITLSRPGDAVAGTPHAADGWARTGDLPTAGRTPTGDGGWDSGGGTAEPARLPTPWAGLLFLVATAEQAGIPDEVLADEKLGGHPLSWSLYHLGRLLVPARPRDPALFALAGVAAEARLPRPEPATPSAAAAALDRHALRWAEATARRVVDGAGTDEGPHATVRRVARRYGALVMWPGWVEVHLPLDGVDLAVRRAGLDVDLGWVPWLGAVVVFRYA